MRFQEAHQLSTEALSKRTGLEPDRVTRLLRPARAPKVVKDASQQEILDDQLDERGAAKLGPPGAPKRERIRLAVMAALEFAKLHACAMKFSPKKSDERTARTIQRSLFERWSFRRAQAFCRTSSGRRVLCQMGRRAPCRTEFDVTCLTRFGTCFDSPHIKRSRRHEPRLAIRKRLCNRLRTLARTDHPLTTTERVIGPGSSRHCRSRLGRRGGSEAV